MPTLCRCASATVALIVAASPACAPQAMLAEVISGISSASCPAPSPRSQLRSIRCLIEFSGQTITEYSQCTLTRKREFVRFAQRDFAEAHRVAGPELRDER